MAHAPSVTNQQYVKAQRTQKGSKGFVHADISVGWVYESHFEVSLDIRVTAHACIMYDTDAPSLSN